MPKPTNLINVCVVGVAGKMGQEVAKTLVNDSLLQLVSAVDRTHAGTPLRQLLGSAVADLTIEDKLGVALDRETTHVMIDFTHPAGVVERAQSALRRGVAPVIGTSGLSNPDLRELELACEEFNTPAMVIPNFAIGAVLMMKFARMAARWMPEAEIIELHHDGKADAPSGTATMTAQQIALGRTHNPERREELIKLEGVRGGVTKGVHIHSVRLRGLVAHQEVIFGGAGETLTLRHDSLDRAGFMEGVKLCARRIWDTEGLTVGMESLLED